MLPSWLFKVKAAFKRPSARTRPSEEADRLQPSEIAKAVNVGSGPAACDATASIEEHGPSSVKPDHSPVESIQEPPESHGFNPALIPSTSDPRATTSPSALHTPGGGSNFFTNSHGFTIHKQNITVGSSKSLFDHLRSHIATGASHNSGERCDAPKCHPDTRVAVHEEIFDWIAGSKEDEPKKVMWLTGPAGTGKTAIVGSIAETCQARGLLAASFFFSSFSGSSNRRVKRCLVATVAYQLSCHPGLERYKERLAHAIEMDPAILELRLEDQVEALVLRPLQEVIDQCDLSTLPKIIAVDGVDEVEAEQYHDPTRRQDVRTNEEDHFDILNTLLRCAHHPSFPFRIVVASRPERVFEDFFALEAKAITYKIFLDSRYDPDADIRLFLSSSFSKIRRRYRLSPSWPTKEAINWLVDEASGQFVFAATVIRFVGDSSDLPQRQLKAVLQLQESADRRGNPFESLDSLYTHVLNSGPNPGSAVVWLRLIEGFLPPSIGGDLLPAFFWRRLLETIEGESEFLLSGYTSLISIPPAEDKTSPFQFYHKSLIEFLADKTRSKTLFVDRKSIQRSCVEASVRILKDKGPCVPLSSSSDTSYFLLLFLQFLRWPITREIPLKHEDDPAPDSPGSILFLYTSPDELASLDATWWTQSVFCISSLVADKPELMELSDEQTREADLFFLYTGAHSQCTPEICNVGCKHWRSAMVSEATKMVHSGSVTSLINTETPRRLLQWVEQLPQV